MRFGENQKGKTFAFMTFSPFKSILEQLKEIPVLLRAHAPDIQRAVRDQKFLHYAQFSCVSRAQLRRAGIPTCGRLAFGGFVFTSAYNGDAEVYFRGFSESLSSPMNALWGGSIGWQNAHPYPKLRKFIRRYQRHVTGHVNSYPSYATEVRTALEIRNEVDRLKEAAVAMSDANFAREFEASVMKLWGNAT
jgi:hypothetical protein